MKTKTPTRGPAGTKGIFADVVEDLKSLEKEDKRLDLEITKLKQRPGMNAQDFRFQVVENGAVQEYDLFGSYVGPAE